MPSGQSSAMKQQPELQRLRAAAAQNKKIINGPSGKYSFYIYCPSDGSVEEFEKWRGGDRRARERHEYRQRATVRSRRRVQSI